MIEVKNLTKSYNGNMAIDDLNFTIEKGQIVGFLGPNGAGKSTTMNIITGYISSTKGNVTIDGFDILKDPEKAKKDIGYLPEMPPLYMDMTVKEYLKFAAKLKGIKRNEVEDSVEQVMQMTKIVEMKNRLNKFLSKGYKQRVGLAAALIGNPEVLILDEPSVGLDPMQIIEIRNLIKNLASNHTIILSSHILSEISAVCDRIIIIHHGKVVMDELMEEIDKNIADSECLSVILKTSKTRMDLNEILKKISKIKKIDFADTQEDGNIHIKLYSDGVDIREEFFNEMVKNNITVLNMFIDRMSLEDIFLEATSEDNVYKMIEQNEKKQNEKKQNETDNGSLVSDETENEIVNDAENETEDDIKIENTAEEESEAENKKETQTIEKNNQPVKKQANNNSSKKKGGKNK